MIYKTSFTRGVVTSVLLQCSAVALLSGAALQPASAQSYTFSSIKIDGNVRVDDAIILTRAGLDGVSRLSVGELNDAVQRVRNLGLFERVNAEPNGRTLNITVVEHPFIGVINVEGNSDLSDEKLLGFVKSQPRRVFNPAQVERDVVALTDYYAQRGRINATVTPKIIRRPENTVDLIFEVNETGVTEIERISFIGNRSFSENRLRRVLATKEAGFLRVLFTSDTFVADRIEFDRRALTDFYRSRGYADFEIQNVDVSLTRERNAHLITFNIQEGQQFTFGDVSFESELSDIDVEQYADRLYTTSGDTYSPVIVAADIDRLERLAVQRGIDFARIDPIITRDERNLKLNIEYRMVEGEKVFVERIDIEGNDTTLDRVVRNQFRMAEGDPFNPRELRNSSERIKALGFFANANIRSRPGSRPDRVIIDVDVEDKSTGSLSLGANFNSDVGIGFQGAYNQRNFLGRGQSFGVTLSTARTNRQLSVSFGEPNFLNRDVGFDFDVSYRDTDNQSALYDTEAFRVSSGIDFPVSDNGRLSLFYASEFTNLSDVSENASQVIQNETARGGLWNHGLGYKYSLDTDRAKLEPTVRYQFRFGQDFGLLGDSEFIKTTASASVEKKVLNEEVTLRASVEGGVLHYPDNNSRVTDRYFLSSRTIRGFELSGLGPRDSKTGDALGGNKFVAARLEGDFSLGLPEEFGLRGGLFADYGSVWDVGNTFGEDVLYNTFTPRAVLGASLFWTTPLGPLRFNFSKALKSEEEDRTNSFEITIDTNF